MEYFHIYKNLLKFAEFRKYTILDKPLTNKEFENDKISFERIEIKCENKIKNNESEKILIILLPESSKYYKKETLLLLIKNYLGKVNKNNKPAIQHLIFILNFKQNNDSKIVKFNKKIREIIPSSTTDLYIEIYDTDKFLYNLPEHSSFPKAVYITPADEVPLLIETYKLDIYQFSHIMQNNALNVWLGAKPLDLLTIERYSNSSAGIVVGYRLVIITEHNYIYYPSSKTIGQQDNLNKPINIYENDNLTRQTIKNCSSNNDIIVDQELMHNNNDNIIDGGTEINSLFNYDDYTKLLQKYVEENKQGEYMAPLTQKDILNSLKYQQNKNLTKTSIHIGQRKLFLSELQFLNNSLNNINDEAFIIYPGGAPSNHIWNLHKLYPNVKIILIDPNEYLIYIDHFHNYHYYYSNKENLPIVYLRYTDINMYKLKNLDKKYIKFYDLKDKTEKIINKLTDDQNQNELYNDINKNDIIDYIINSDNRIFLIEDYYNNNYSELFSLLKTKSNYPIYFISDIRTTIVKESLPYDLDILWNSCIQFNWINILKPNKCILKFRTPYYNDIEKIDKIPKQQIEDFEYCKKNYNLDFLENYKNHKLIYFAGENYTQAWEGQTSAETRLVFDYNDDTLKNLINYNHLEYEDKYYFYNNIQRIFLLHKNKYADKQIGFDHCGDCSIEANILENYKNKPGCDELFDIIEYVKFMNQLFGRNILSGYHGHLFETFTMEWYKQLIK